jgi:hypothetical protein
VAKGKSTEAEAQVLPSEGEVTPETALPEQVEATPEAGTPETAVQGIDLEAQLQTLSKEERDALHEKVWPGLRDGDRAWGKTEGEKKALAQWQADQQQRAQANQELRGTLKNLGLPDDDSEAAGHILSFAEKQAKEQANRQSLANLESMAEAEGLSPEENSELLFKLHQAAARDGRIATFADWYKAVTGERYMPKGEVTKQLRAEVEAVWEEKMGKQREGEAAPVSVGQGQATSGVARADATLMSPTATAEEKRAAFRTKYGVDPP